MSFTLRVNGRTHTVDVEPTTPLLYVLRNDLDLHGPRFGCGLGQCGACTVLIKGEAVRSCVRPVSAVQGAEITTLEGLGAERHAPPDAAGLDRRAGAAVRLLPERADPHGEGAARSQTRIRPTRRSGRAWHGTLCRCMTYYRIQAAIKRAAKAMAHARPTRARMSRSKTPGSERLDRRAGTSSRPPACWSSASARCRWPPWRDSLAADRRQRAAAGPYPDPDFRQLDSWIVIRADNTATFYVGKTDLGQGTGTAFRQIMSDELDIAYDQTSS